MAKNTANNNNSKETLAFYWKAASVYKGRMAVIFITIVGATAIGVIIPIFFKGFFNVVVESGDSSDAIKKLIAILGIIALFKLGEWLFWRISSFTAVNFSTRVMADLTNNCFAYLHKHSFAYFNNNFVGSMVRRVKSFSNAFDTIADNIIWELLPLIVSATAILVVLWNVNPWLSVGVITWMFFYIVASLVFSKFKLKYDIRRNELESSSSGFLADTITNNANLKLMNGYDREVKGFAKATDDLRLARKKSWDTGNMFEALQGIFITLLEIGILYFAINLWKENKITIGDFVLIQAYISNIFGKIYGFGRIIRRFYESFSDASEMTDILMTPHEIKDVENAVGLVVKKGSVEFKGVDFRYGDSRQVLSGFDLSIKPGEKVALIGPSGAGKTTVVKLLMRMHDLTGGKIEIDGQDISSVTQESLWENISLVPQDPILFHRTLMDNIRYGKPEASDEEVIEAAKAAHCHEFIMNSPEAYGTYVGERGIKLSGGERQRVAIARAILRNAPILILDEATSSLDSESESLIQDALNMLMKDKTVIVIAHRLSTIKKMDRIIAIDNGRIVEEGDHSGLSGKEEGMYSRLWKLQAGGFGG